MSIGPDHRVVAEALSLVAPAETSFRSRWRLSTLKRVDEALHGMLVEQIDLFNAALVTGSSRDVREQSEAMVRGWRAAVAALESPLLADDAYFVGFDANTGTRVVISDQIKSVARIQGAPSERVIMMTPDEVATVMAGLGVLREAKSLFPDTEIVGASPNPNLDQD